MNEKIPAATIIIPTHDAELTLPFALNSAINQTFKNIEIIIAGDGVSPKFKLQIAKFVEIDKRIKFLDFPKGENRGERNRHFAVLEAKSDRIIYLADDDILLPLHVELIMDLLEIAPFAMSLNGYVDESNELQLFPTDLSNTRWVDWHLLEPQRNRVSITGTSHTKQLYQQLEEGWKVVSPGQWTDLELWKQFFKLPFFKGITGTEMTTIQLPANFRNTNESELLNKYQFWFDFSQSSDGHLKLQKMVEARTKTQLIETSAELTNHSIALKQSFKTIDELNEKIKKLNSQIESLSAQIVEKDLELKASKSTRAAIKIIIKRLKIFLKTLH